eukprot:gene6600-10763_t
MGNKNSKPKNQKNNKTEKKKEALDERASEDVIIGKLKKGNRQAVNMPEDELREWARSLCVASELTEWYLNPEFAQTKTAMDKIEQLNAKINSSKKESAFSSGTESTVKEDDDFKFDDIDFDFDEIEQDAKKPEMKISGDVVKIKLVIAEICKSDAQKAIRKMLSPILTKIDNQQQFGMFHSALVVGPWYLEWNNSSLCIPRKCYSSAAMLAADLDFKGNVSFKLDETIKKISKVIIDWNVNREYNQRNANCQQFIDEMTLEMGINLDELFQGPLKDYLKRLREKGQSEIYFPISKDLMESLKINEDKMKFDSHEDLDNFVNQIVEADPMFEENFDEHWLLLKSFDRAFWLRHFKLPDEKKYIPHKCPFKDPTVTTSFKKEWF